MRVTDRQRFNSLENNLASSLDAYNSVQQEISTGKQLNALSDDPAGGAQSLALRAALVDNNQYQRNVASANTFLTSTESALNNAVTLVTSAHSIALQAANTGIQDSNTLNALAAQVDGIIQQLTQTANTDVHGKYVFGGTQTQAAPYVPPTPLPASGDPTPAYVGGTGTITATIGKNETLTLNTPGGTTYSGAFTALQTLRNDLKNGTTANLSADVDAVNAQITVLSSAQAAVGARLTETASVQTRLKKAQGQFQDAVSNIEDVDLSRAYVQLQTTQNTYQAALVATSRAFQYSLSDYLK